MLARVRIHSEKSARTDYYVYALICDELPFYVGKGRGDRAQQHLRDARNGAATAVAGRIRDLLTAGRSVQSNILVAGLAQIDAYKLERDLILLVGRAPAGPLVNKTPGGNGFYNISRESVERRSAPRRGVPRSPEVRAKISAAKMGHSVSDNLRKIMSENAKKQAARVGAKEAFLARINCPDVIARRNASNKKRCADPAVRAEYSARAKKQFAGAEGRQRARDAAYRRQERPGEYEKVCAALERARTVRWQCAPA